jgi:hypothetical protein
MSARITPTLLALALLAMFSSRDAAGADANGIEFFEAKVRPVLAERCYQCHSASAKKLKAELRLDSKAGILKGGESGTPAVVPGNLGDSLLISAIHYEEGGLQMPPKARLPADQISDLEAWVKMGAPYPEEMANADAPTSRPVAMTLADGRKFWSFQRPREQTVPQTTDSKWGHNEIDQFILRKLHDNALSPSPIADKRTLIRRATFDLIGLPPTPQEVDDFVNDASPDAFAKVVDRLLASPHYGERWGRYWLDVARYADTKGYVFQEERQFGFAWTYRDWVIRSLNEDLPYDQFLIQQIAADKIESKDDKRPLAAMGFLTVGRRFLNNQPDIIDDRIDVVTRGTMGLTVSCARCHDHKYDPIPQADYYSLYGVFASSREPAELPVIGERTAKTDAYEKEVAKRRQAVADFKEKRSKEIIEDLRKPEKINADLAAAAEGLKLDETQLQKLAETKSLHPRILVRYRDFVKKPTTQPATTQPGESAVQLALNDPASPIKLPPDEITNLYPTADLNKVKELEIQVQNFVATSPDAPDRAMAMEDLPKPVEPHIFLRGNANRRGKQVPRQFPAILSSDDRKPFTQGSGRLELAHAIASKDNPLTARVMVNRVWQYHFGNGLVRTPSDFGVRGEPPTHPKLLDWLALRFANDDGWSLKKLHRRIMLSAAYQQTSIDTNADARAKDPDNRLLWRQNPRRLDFEAMRDSLLAVSKQLDLTMGGRSVDILADPIIPRRTVYAFIDRQNLPGLFRTFDFASPDSTSGKRFVTSVPQQALFMMNSPFALEQARKLAGRQDIVAEADPAARVQRLYREVLDRNPTAHEIELAVKFVNVESEQATTLAKTGPTAWQYGYGEFDESAQHLASFAALPHFTGSAWQGGPKLPNRKLGWAMLNQAGGHPGDLKHAVVRRWTAPRDCTVAITGDLSHPEEHGDGVRARLVTTHDGVLATWIVHHKQAQTSVSGIVLKPGDTIDFIVDCGGAGDIGFDSFNWKITITKQAPTDAVAGDDTGSSWDSAAEFSGPRATPLSPWEKFAQVLLESNEFAFVD